MTRIFISTLVIAQQLVAQLSQNCIVSVLNRNALANPDGSWVLPNVPANMGQVRARATCVEGGITRSGESGLFSIAANGAVNLPNIKLGTASPILEALTISPANPVLTSPGQSLQLTITARYPNGSTGNVTTAATGTSYTISNPAIASISPNSLVTAVSGGTVVVQAINDGAPGIATVRVAFASRDSDGDGISDEIELQNGLDPNNPVDGQEDFDRDGLTNTQELARGTNIRTADTDGDGLLDGAEVTLGTNPLLADTDGDLIPDGIEVQTATDPLNRNSYDLRRVTATSTLTPSSFVLNTSILSPLVSQQLRFRVNLIDGKTTLDLTAKSIGTSYSSSNLNVCNFGAQDGLVFAGQPGSCEITATNNNLSLRATGLVNGFTPSALSFLTIPGTAMNVDVNGNYAYVAAGAAGLVVVDVADRSRPRIAFVYDTPGFANDVVVSGSYAYVADGPSGLRVVNIANPLAPVLAGSIGTAGDAQDVAVRASLAIVAYSGAFSGIQVVDVSSPSAPREIGRKALSTGVLGVDYDPVRRIAGLALGSGGLAVLDLSNPVNPIQIGSLPGGDVQDVVIQGNHAFLADIARSFTVVDLTNPAAPALLASTPLDTGGRLADVAVAANGLAFGADIFFVNDVPIIDVTNRATPTPRFLLPFRQFRDDDGTGIALDSAFVYLTANRGDGRLYIGQYQSLEDRNGVPPSVQISGPAGGTTVIQGSTILISANATDDVAVAAVSFFDKGALIDTDTSAPFEASYVVPTSVTGLALTATATDLGGNVANSSAVSVNVIPDPLTTVTGRVLSSAGTGFAGAAVTTLGRSATSSGDGTFAIGAVPTVKGDVSVVATATIGGVQNAGFTAAFPPVRSGITAVGDVTIRPCTLPPSGLAGFWPADGSTNELVNGANAVLNRGATYAPGLVGHAFSLDGAGGYVSVPDSPSLNPVNGTTIEGWIRRTAAVGFNDPVFKKSGPGQVNGYALEYYGQDITFYVYTNNWYSSGGVPIQDNVWTHVAGVYDGTTIRLYVNGALASSGSAPPPLTPSPGELNIGRDPSNHDRLFKGLIDEFSLYDRALSPNEIQTIFSAGDKGKCRP